MAAMILALVFLTRSRFFYYMFVSGIEKLIVIQLRMTLGDPRPFHLDPKIKPWKCWVTFGNPSNNAMCSMIASVVMFLDMFHGVPISFSYAGDSIYFGCCSWFISLILALYWASAMPFAGYVGGT